MHCSLTKRSAILAFAAIALCVSGGCGQRQYPVSGKVTYNGGVYNKSEGIIVFVGPKGEQSEGTIATDGTYRIAAVPEGLNRIAVYYMNPRLQSDKPGKPKHGEKPKPNPPAYLTPASFASHETSGFSVEIDKETVYDMNMTGPPIE
jgi:hypothetical protein